MTQISTLLELRSKIKSRKPDFIRQDNPKRPKLNDKWRKPKGIHSKIRHHFKGRRKMPSPGYKSPIKTRWLHFSGLKVVRVFSPIHISKIKQDSEGAIISKNVGMKKRLDILRKAKELNVKVMNLNVDENIRNIEDKINLRKKREAKKEETKDQKIPKEEKSENQKELDLKLTDEGKKSIEKLEKDKLLIKRT